jgi:hypothetical protein
MQLLESGSSTPQRSEVFLICHLSFLYKKSHYECSAPFEVECLTGTLKGSDVFFKQQNTGFSLSITKQGPERPFQWRNEFHGRIEN